MSFFLNLTRLRKPCATFCSTLLLVFATSGFCETTEHVETITVSLLIFSGEQRNAFESIALDFHRNHPNYKIRYVSLNDSAYKAQIYDWLDSPGSIDIFDWPWASRLERLYEAKLITSISDIWRQPPVYSALSTFYKDLVTVDGQQVAMPFTSGFWGFFYNKALFEKYNLHIPTSFSELIGVCDQLVDNDITPILIGLKSPWPAAAWFEYINIRINGLAFHERTTQGIESFHSPEIARVFEYWKELISHQCFYDSPYDFELKQTLPMLYRNRAAMILSGSFSITQFAQPIRDNIGFFPFPAMRDNIDLYELLPTNVFVISAKTDNLVGAKKFLAFMAKPEVQYKFNEAIKYLPVNSHTLVPIDDLIRQGQINLERASGFTQYFDRDTSQAYADAALAVFSKFIGDGDIEQAQIKLEEVRLALFATE